MRRALIGTSSPIGYDYRYSAPRVKSDRQSSPNPIIESPFGLFLLYDEVWFWCRSLCPANMRSLPYVKFVDEHYDLSGIVHADDTYLEKLADEEESLQRQLQPIHLRGSGLSFEDWKIANGITWDGAVDNHTHEIRIGPIRSHGNATADRLVFDLVLADRLGLDGFELITNSSTHSCLSHAAVSNHLETKLAEFLVIERIPNYLTVRGPYHPVLDEARENQYLVDFRKWISSTSPSLQDSELPEIKESVERSIRELQNKLFLKYLDPKTQYLSIGKTAVGDAAGLLLPGISTAAAALEGIVISKTRTAIRWQGFLVSLDAST